MPSPPTCSPRARDGRPTRVAVVGAGFIAAFHIEILAGTPGVELVAVVDPSLERAQAAARGVSREGREVRALEAVAALADLQVDVAHVLVPPDLHARVVRELLGLSIGAFVEKPLALDSAEARDLEREARARGLVLGVNHNAVFHPAFARLLRRVRSGELGSPRHVRVCLSVPLRQLDAGDFSHWMFREPRNIVLEQAPHPCAQLVELVGPVREARATVLSSRELLPGQVFHERWLVAARGERATVELYFSFGDPFTRSTVQVLCSDGEVEADLFHDLLTGESKSQHLEFFDSFLAGLRRGGALRRGAWGGLKRYLLMTLGLGPRQDAFYAGMRESIRAFHAAFRAGAPPPVGGEQGSQVLEWCEAIVRDVPRAAPAPALPAAGPARPGEVVVLGATGFIGTRLVRDLRAAGVPVTALVRRAHSLPPVLTAESPGSPPVRLLRASLEDPASLRAAVAGARCVLQLATGNGPTWEAVERAMVGGSVALAQACLDAGVERFVFVSSTAALYMGADAGAELHDEEPADPRPEARPLYARGKIMAERALLALHLERGLPLTIVRPAVVLGPGSPMQHSGLGLWVRDNHCVGWGRGDTPLPLVHVDDVASALARLALHRGKDLDGKALNLAADTGLCAREVVAELSKATGRSLCFHPRSLWTSQAMEIGKWIVKRVGRRPGAQFPSWRDLKSRALVPRLSCRTARDVLGWRPVEDREGFLEIAVRAHGSGAKAQATAARARTGGAAVLDGAAAERA